MRRFLKTLNLTAGVLLGSALGAAAWLAIMEMPPAPAAQISLQTGAVDPSNVRGTVNTLIQSINSTVSAAGAGATNTGLNVASVATAVNALQITPGGTGIPLRIGVGASFGQTVDTNADISIEPAGTGLLRFGCGSCLVANGSKSMSLGSTGPSAASATPQGWLNIKGPNGGSYYIPLY